MALVRTAQAALIDTAGDISFLMQDGEKLVRVDAQRRLLEGLGGLLRRSSAGCLAALEEHRQSIERIAVAKYERHDYLGYANSYVITITADDWMRQPGADLPGSARVTQSWSSSSGLEGARKLDRFTRLHLPWIATMAHILWPARGIRNQG
jgi:hypothetical protein